MVGDVPSGGGGSVERLDATVTAVEGVSLVFFFTRGPPSLFVVDSFTEVDLFLPLAFLAYLNLAEARPFHLAKPISSPNPPESEPENWSANATTAFKEDPQRCCSVY
jgi:hypothetical protein